MLKSSSKSITISLFSFTFLILAMWVFSSNTYSVSTQKEEIKSLFSDTIPLLLIDRDSIWAKDTLTVFDTETYRETVQITRKKVSMREYYKDYKITDPMEQTDTIIVFDPETYTQSIYVKNYKENRIDTLSKDQKPNSHRKN